MLGVERSAWIGENFCHVMVQKRVKISFFRPKIPFFGGITILVPRLTFLEALQFHFHVINLSVPCPLGGPVLFWLIKTSMRRICTMSAWSFVHILIFQSLIMSSLHNIQIIYHFLHSLNFLYNMDIEYKRPVNENPKTPWHFPRQSFRPWSKFWEYIKQKCIVSLLMAANLIPQMLFL